MKSNRTWMALAAAALVLAGCVKKSEYEALQTQLDESQERAEEYEGLYQEVMEERTVALQEAAEYLPQAASELKDQLNVRLEEVTKNLDAQLRADVQNTLDELTGTMADGYRQLRDQNSQLQGQLSESRNLLERLMDRTGDIETAVGTDRVALLTKREAVLERIETLVADVNDWKYKHVDCKECEERLRLNQRERDAIAQLQLQTVSSLESLRGEFVLMASDLEATLEGEDGGEGGGDDADTGE